MLGSASQPASPVDVELDRIQTLIESNAIPEATDALAQLEPQLPELPSHLRARHNLLRAQTLGTGPEAEHLLYDALLELTPAPAKTEADPEAAATPAPIDPAVAEVTHDLTFELVLRQELRGVADATNQREFANARGHIANAKRLLELHPNPAVTEAIVRWEEYYVALKNADR